MEERGIEGAEETAEKREIVAERWFVYQTQAAAQEPCLEL